MDKNNNEEFVFLEEGLDLLGNDVEELVNEECSNFVVVKNH